MLQNAYLLAKIGADTAENERIFAEISLKIVNYPTGPLLIRDRALRCLAVQPAEPPNPPRRRAARPRG